jgi:hypothetical protein
MSGFFGVVMSSLRTGISTTAISASRNAITSSITAGASNTNGGTLSYLWKTTGNTPIINTPSSSSTTVTGSGIVGTTNLYCDITDSVTGVTTSSPQCTITWTSTAPNAPTIGVSSAADKSFTINWTAPTDDGGSAITGYYVQNSTNGGASWSTAILVSAGTTSYNWSGNGIIYNGNTYIGQVAAVNDVGTGTYSGISVGRVPTFAAPSCSLTGQAGYPSILEPGRRPLTVTINPTACVDYSYTQVYLFSNPFQDFPEEEYSSYVQASNGGPGILFVTNLSTAGQTGNVYSILQQNLFQGTQYWNTVSSNIYYVFVRTYNNDVYYVQSPVVSFTTAALVPYYVFNPASLTFANGVQLYQTGQFTVTGNTFSQISTIYITSNDWYVNKLNVSARTATLSSAISIVSSSRNFLVDYTFATTGSFTQVYNALSTLGTPFTGLANVTRNVNIDIADVNYDNDGDGRVRIRGVGSIGTWATAQRILVTVTAYGQIRTLNYY